MCYTNNSMEHWYTGHRKLTKLYAKNERPISILGAPFWKGQKISGTELSPELFRKQNIVSQIIRLGYNSVVDYRNLNFKDDPRNKITIFRNNFTEISNQFTLSEAILLIEIKVEQILRNGETLVILGGDHSITARSILGNAKANPYDFCVIYVDAHGDINNCETTRSGNLHGNLLASLF